MKKTNILFLFFIFLFYLPLTAQLDDVLVHAEQMPYFSGCEKLKDGTEKKRYCSNEALVAFLASHVKYPKEAKEAGTEGTVYVSFIIDEMGNVTHPSILRDIGNGCGEAAIDILKAMPRWEPGKDKGKNVKVKLNLPVQFFLKNGISNPVETDSYKITWGTLKGNRISVKDFKDNLDKIIMVRNRFGEAVSFEELTFTYKRKRQFLTSTSNGTLSKKQKRIIRKAKAGGKFYIEVLVHEGNKKIKTGREFELF